MVRRVVGIAWWIAGLVVCAPMARADNVLVNLAGAGQEMAFDSARNRLYVTIPSANAVAVIGLPDYEVIEYLSVGVSPHGIDLSPDGSMLFVAPRESGGFVTWDVETGEREFYVGVPEIDNSLSYDVVESDGRVFLSANPGSGGFAYVVMFEFGETGYEVTRILSARCSPTFEEDRQGRYLYVGECFSPNSLYKIDLAQDPPKRVLEDAHGSVSGTLQSAVSPDGDFVYLGSGQVLRAGSFLEEARITSGFPAFGEGGDRVFMAASTGVIRVWDTATYQQTGEVHLAASGNVQDFLVLPGEGRFLVLTGNRVIGVDPAYSCLEVGPAILESPTPPDGASGVALDATLRWGGDPSGCPTTYAVHLTGPDGIERLVSTALSQRVCDPGPLEPGSWYEWRVVATNSFGVSEGPAWGFRTTACVPEDPNVVREILGGTVQEMVVDEAHHCAYLSIPSRSEVVRLSLETGRVVDRIPIDGTPRGIALDPDGTRLSVAINGAGSVDMIDLITGTVRRISIGSLLGSPLTWDVIEPREGSLFVSSNPGSGGSAYIVRVNLADDSLVRVAGGRNIRAAPVFASDPAARYLYVGEGFSPNSLYKLDLDSPSVPIVGEDNHGDVSGTSRIKVGPDGSRVYLVSGQVIDAATIFPVGRVKGIAHTFDPAGSRVYTATKSFMYIQDRETFGVLDAYPVDFSGQDPIDMHMAGDGTFVVVAADLAFTTIPPLIVDCNDNAIPDECEIAEGSASDVDGDGALDECGCPPAADIRDAVVCAHRVSCTPFGPDNASLEMAVRNPSAADARWVLIAPRPGISVDPNVVYLETPIEAGSVGRVPPVSIDGPPGAAACVDFVLLSSQGGECASGSVCFDVPDCCADLDLISATPGADGAIEAVVRVTNQTADPFGHIFFFDPDRRYESDPDYIRVSPPLEPLASMEIPLRLTLFDRSSDVELIVTTHTPEFVLCCEERLRIPIPGSGCTVDFNHDGRTDSSDFCMLAQQFGAVVDAGSGADCSADGRVDSSDFIMLASEFGCGGD